MDWLEFFWKSFFSNLLGQGIPFLNLPIWAIFVDPTDLSLYLLLPTLDQTNSTGWTQPHPHPQPGLAKQHWLTLRLR